MFKYSLPRSRALNFLKERPHEEYNTREILTYVFDVPWELTDGQFKIWPRFITYLWRQVKTDCEEAVRQERLTKRISKKDGHKFQWVNGKKWQL